MLFTSQTIVAQQKFEREFKVKATEVPLTARSFVDSLQIKNRIVWIKEQSFNGVTYEAKFKWNGLHYSIEFDTTGALEDVEVDMHYKSLPDSVRQKLDKVFTIDFKKHGIHKTQLQYTGPASDVFLFLKGNTTLSTIVKRYEVEVVGTAGRFRKLYEYLFSSDGALIRRNEVVVRNSDNLEY